jgi:SAM-dependent methyltransferase
MKLKAADIQQISEHLGAASPVELNPFMQCMDHSVSRETFSLFKDAERDLLVTLPQPSEKNLPDYYQSEDYISHTDSKRNLLEIAYQLVKQFSLKRKVKLVTRVNQGQGRILDVGCGTGDFLQACEQKGWSIAGIEPNEKARQLASTKTNFNDYQRTVEELIESNPGSFDVITMWHVLEHVPNLADFIDKIKSLLKPNGVLVVAVPNFKSWDAKHYNSYWAAYDVPRHLWHFSRKSMERIFSEFDMKILEELPMKFDSYYVSLLSEKYKKGKQNFFSAFYQGLRSNQKAGRSGEYSSLIYLIK